MTSKIGLRTVTQFSLYLYMTRPKIYLLFALILILFVGFSFGFSYLFPLHSNENNEVARALQPMSIFVGLIVICSSLYGVLISVKQILSIVPTLNKRKNEEKNPTIDKQKKNILLLSHLISVIFFLLISSIIIYNVFFI